MKPRELLTEFAQYQLNQACADQAVFVNQLDAAISRGDIPGVLATNELYIRADSRVVRDELIVALLTHDYDVAKGNLYLLLTSPALVDIYRITTLFDVIGKRRELKHAGKR